MKQGELLAHLSIPLIVFAPYSMKLYASTKDIKPLMAIEDFSKNIPEEEDPDGAEAKFTQDAARRLEKIFVSHGIRLVQTLRTMTWLLVRVRLQAVTSTSLII